MKFLCPGCERLVALGRFSLVGSTLTVVCPACGRESNVAQDSGEPSDDSADAPRRAETPAPQVSQRTSVSGRIDTPFTPPPDCCPKCVAVRRHNAIACPQCGLMFDQFSRNLVDLSVWLEAKWQALLDNWSDAEAHERLRSAAVAQGELAAVGRLYRIYLAWRPDDAIARHGKDEVVRLATLSQMTLEARPETPEATPVWKYAAAVLLVAMLAGLFYALTRMLAPPPTL